MAKKKKAAARKPRWTARTRSLRISADLVPVISDWITDGVIPVKKAEDVERAIPLIAAAVQASVAFIR